MPATATAKALNLSNSDIREAVEVGFTLLNNDDHDRSPSDDTVVMRWLDEGGPERLDIVLEEAEMDILTVVAITLAEKAEDMFHASDM